MTTSTHISQALNGLNRAVHYSKHSEQVAGKAHDALDGFVGPAMVVSHDNESRNVSKQGEDLAFKLRKSLRYLDKGVLNQKAYHGALVEAQSSLKSALQESSEQAVRSDLQASLDVVSGLIIDQVVESDLGTLGKQMKTCQERRVREVEADGEGKDVSRHGRPIWDLFEDSMVRLDAGGRLIRREYGSLETVIERLQTHG